MRSEGVRAPRGRIYKQAQPAVRGFISLFPIRTDTFSLTHFLAPPSCLLPFSEQERHCETTPHSSLLTPHSTMNSGLFQAHDSEKKLQKRGYPARFFREPSLFCMLCLTAGAFYCSAHRRDFPWCSRSGSSARRMQSSLQPRPCHPRASCRA